MFYKQNHEYETEVYTEINTDKKPNYRLVFIIFAAVIAILLHYQTKNQFICSVTATSVADR